MHEQLAGTQRSVVEDVAMLVRPDVAVKQPEFAIFDQAIGIFQVGPASAYRVYLRCSEGHPRLKFFQHEVVVRSNPVYSCMTLTSGSRVQPRIFLRIRLGLMSGLAPL